MMPPRETKGDIMKTRRNVRRWLAIPIFAAALLPLSLLAQGEDNPAGVAGIYNGNVLDAGNFDPYTRNARRVVDDIVVPGSVGAYPLKWTRYFNNRNPAGDGPTTGWTYSYENYTYTSPTAGFPDGRLINFNNNCGVAVEENIGTFTAADGNTYTGILLADGGVVAFSGYPGAQTILPSALIDPYGQKTTLSYVIAGYCGAYTIYNLDRVTEPGGRYSSFTGRVKYPAAPRPRHSSLPELRRTTVEAMSPNRLTTRGPNGQPPAQTIPTLFLAKLITAMEI
jgi:hypothetical protein